MLSSAPFFIARTDDLVVEEVGDELVVYDRRSDVAHCLSPIAAVVWRACDGGASFEQILDRMAESGLVAPGRGESSQELLEAAALELEKNGLLECRYAGSDGISRRRALRRIAGVAAAAVAAPLVVSAAVPKLAEAHGSLPGCKSGAQVCGPVSSEFATNDCCAGSPSPGPYCNASGACTPCVPNGSPPTQGTCVRNGHNVSCCSGNCGTGVGNGTKCEA